MDLGATTCDVNPNLRPSDMCSARTISSVVAEVVDLQSTIIWRRDDQHDAHKLYRLASGNTSCWGIWPSEVLCHGQPGLYVLKLCECCFAGAVSTFGGSEGCRPSAPKVRIGREHHASGALRWRAESGSRGTPQKPNMVGVASWTVSAPKVRHRRSLGSVRGASWHVSTSDV
jgi:hypothetical protein